MTGKKLANAALAIILLYFVPGFSQTNIGNSVGSVDVKYVMMCLGGFLAVGILWYTINKIIEESDDFL
jgi:ATP-dependent Lon protease